MEIDATVLARQWYAAVVTGVKDDVLGAMMSRWRVEYDADGMSRIKAAVDRLCAIDCLNRSDVDGLRDRGVTVAQARRFKADAEKSARRMH